MRASTIGEDYAVTLTSPWSSSSHFGTIILGPGGGRMVETAIIGAGPYGLSLAAHLAAAGMEFRIFGSPLASWRAHMPKGMQLKSDGFASNISSPDPDSTLKSWCAQRGVAYDDNNLPVSLSTFVDYSA